MKPLALTFALFATVSVLAQPADPASAADKGTLSPGAAERLKETRPEFKPVPEKQPLKTFAPDPSTIRKQSVDRAPADELATDPEVLELPKMTVKQQPKPRPRLNVTDTKAVMLGPEAFNLELAKKNTTGLDRGLNKFSLGGQSAAERAREEYNIQQKRVFLDDVLTISKAAEQTDPANAKALREAAAKP